MKHEIIYLMKHRMFLQNVVSKLENQQQADHNMHKQKIQS